MLSFAEEIYLLALDDMTGQTVLAGGQIALNQALVAGVLGELSFMRRLDADLEALIVLDASPTGNPILDTVLTPLRTAGLGPRPLRRCLDDLYRTASTIETLTREELVRKQVIKSVAGRVFWVIPSRRYPVIDNRELIDVERRLRAIVTDPEMIPDPRDTVLVSLVTACGLFPEILSPRELRRSQERIHQLSRLDLVGGSLIDHLNSLNLAMATAAF